MTDLYLKLYVLVPGAAVLVLFVRRLRAGRLTPVAAALVSAAVTPWLLSALATVPLFAYLPVLALLAAGLYLSFGEILDGPTDRRG
jgi:hypothetical protein